MKKIIAFAVASAFVAPVMAEVSVSVNTEFFMTSSDGTQEIQGGDQIVTFSGSSETSNGYTVSASMNVLTSGSATPSTDGGESISISGPFGSVSVGDVASGLDNVGDYSDMAPRDGGFGADGADHSVLYVLPSLADGVKVSASFSPEGDTADDNFGGSAEGDSYSVAYNFGNGEVYAGTLSADGSDDMTAYGVKVGMSGATVAYEKGTQGDDDFTGMAASYAIGETTLVMEVQERTGGTTVDQSIVALTHNMGGGLSVYLQQTQDDDSDTDTAYAGMIYAF